MHIPTECVSSFSLQSHLCVCVYVCGCVFIRKDISTKCHLYISLIWKPESAIINVVPLGSVSRQNSAILARNFFLHMTSPRAFMCMCAHWQRQWHRAHSDSLQHLCNHDSPPASEGTKGGRMGLPWLEWQRDWGRWCRAAVLSVWHY